MPDPHSCHHVLVVEDDPSTREVICHVLERETYRVTTADNGREALRLLQSEEHPCVILLDLFMPVLNGDEVCAELMKDPHLSKIPVIMISAQGSLEEERETPNIVAFFRKPFPFLRLLKMVEECCQRK